MRALATPCLFLAIALCLPQITHAGEAREVVKEVGTDIEGIDAEGQPEIPLDEKETKKEENVGLRPVGAPIFTYNSDFGPSFGAHVALYDYGDGSVKPYKYLLRIQGLFGTNGDTNDYLSFDAPQIFRSKFRVQARLGFQVIHNYNYFGMGNNTGDSQPSSYYHFKRTTPGLLINIIRELGHDFKAVIGYMVEQRIIDAGSNTQLAADNPRGVDGGYDSEIRFGMAYDSRDVESMPKKGNFIDIFAELPLRAFGSSYNYARFTLTDRNFISIFDRLVWANRIIIKTSVGSVPFYESAKIGGFGHFDGFGGNNTIRGLRQSRYIDRANLIFNEELRLRVFGFRMFKQRFDVYGVAFADFGRVFSSLEAFTLTGMHLGGGGGARICWNKNFILAPDFGFSKEGYSVYFGFQNLF